ncbi:MAG TPA: dihydrofolate reductase family protein, partial [Coriobacteriia bacterium]|nr:dihydrofolate reductase family protein [Coriobacteriia bacterium]
LDGHAALVPGRRARITGTGGRSVTMLLRAHANAVAVGAATVAVDDPALTLRGEDEDRTPRRRLRVVLSRTTVPSAACRLATDGQSPALLVVGEGADEGELGHLADCGVDIATYPLARGIGAALSAVGQRGIDDLLVEAGPRLLTSLYDAGCIDELICVHAGGMAGGQSPALYLGTHGGSGDVLPRPLEAIESAVVDGDAVTVWRPRATLSGTHAATA